MTKRKIQKDRQYNDQNKRLKDRQYNDQKKNTKGQTIQ